MKRSTDRSLTTHAGSLPRPSDLSEMLRAKEAGRPYDAQALQQRLAAAGRDTGRWAAPVLLCRAAPALPARER